MPSEHIQIKPETSIVQFFEPLGMGRSHSFLCPRDVRARSHKFTCKHTPASARLCIHAPNKPAIYHVHQGLTPACTYASDKPQRCKAIFAYQKSGAQQECLKTRHGNTRAWYYEHPWLSSSLGLPFVVVQALAACVQYFP